MAKLRMTVAQFEAARQKKFAKEDKKRKRLTKTASLPSDVPAMAAFLVTRAHTRFYCKPDADILAVAWLERDDYYLVAGSPAPRVLPRVQLRTAVARAAYDALKKEGYRPIVEADGAETYALIVRRPSEGRRLEHGSASNG